METGLLLGKALGQHEAGVFFVGGLVGGSGGREYAGMDRFYFHVGLLGAGSGNSCVLMARYKLAIILLGKKSLIR